MKKDFITECINSALNEEIIRKKVRQIVKEEVEKEKDKEKEGNVANIEGKKSFVTNALKNDDSDKYDHANLAYQLWPSLDPDTARSYFSKCVRGERNFSNKDITSLYELIRTK